MAKQTADLVEKPVDMDHVAEAIAKAALQNGVTDADKDFYTGKILTIDNQGGTIYWTGPDKRAPETFVYATTYNCSTTLA